MGRVNNKEIFNQGITRLARTGRRQAGLDVMNCTTKMVGLATPPTSKVYFLIGSPGSSVHMCKPCSTTPTPFASFFSSFFDTVIVKRLPGILQIWV